MNNQSAEQLTQFVNDFSNGRDAIVKDIKISDITGNIHPHHDKTVMEINYSARLNRFSVICGGHAETNHKLIQTFRAFVNGVDKEDLEYLTFGEALMKVSKIRLFSVPSNPLWAGQDVVVLVNTIVHNAVNGSMALEEAKKLMSHPTVNTAFQSAVSPFIRCRWYSFTNTPLENYDKVARDYIGQLTRDAEIVWEGVHKPETPEPRPIL